MTSVTRRRVQWRIFVSHALVIFRCASLQAPERWSCVSLQARSVETKSRKWRWWWYILRAIRRCVKENCWCFRKTHKYRRKSSRHFRLAAELYRQSMIVGQAGNIKKLKTPVNYQKLLLHVLLEHSKLLKHLEKKINRAFAWNFKSCPSTLIAVSLSKFNVFNVWITSARRFH